MDGPGHGYIYNPLTEEESYQALTNALSTKTEPVEQDVKKVVSITSILSEYSG